MISFRKFLTVINEEDALGAPPAGGGDAGAAPGGDAGAPPGGDAGAPPADMGGGAPPPDMGGGGAPPGGDMGGGGAPPAAGAAGGVTIKLEEQPRDVFEFLKELDKKGFFNMPRK
jgi:hypothetical protein